MRGDSSEQPFTVTSTRPGSALRVCTAWTPREHAQILSLHTTSYSAGNKQPRGRMTESTVQPRLRPEMPRAYPWRSLGCSVNRPSPKPLEGHHPAPQPPGPWEVTLLWQMVFRVTQMHTCQPEPPACCWSGASKPSPDGAGDTLGMSPPRTTSVGSAGPRAEPTASLPALPLPLPLPPASCNLAKGPPSVGSPPPHPSGFIQLISLCSGCTMRGTGLFALLFTAQLVY